MISNDAIRPAPTQQATVTNRQSSDSRACVRWPAPAVSSTRNTLPRPKGRVSPSLTVTSTAPVS